jgi:hypothetical protein
MAFDLSMALIHATVQLEQPLGDGTRTVGTGFLIADAGPDGATRIVLVTAEHVFDRMPGPEARIGYRRENTDGSWTYAPTPLTIRDKEGHALWIQHPDKDIAVMRVSAPEAFARAAIPKTWLAEDQTFAKLAVGPGDEMMALGFPRGLSANGAGFPILRSGRVASFPVAPASLYPTFLLDFSVFPGNSGGPVFMAETAGRRAGAAGTPPAQFIAGLLSQQVELNKERLEIEIVVHARYIREAIDVLDRGASPASATAAAAPEAKAASAGEATEKR